jgi:Flp pilus assembly pilin Flp
LKDECGQELIEHAVLTGFAVLVIAIVINGMTGVNLMWGSANTQLSNAVISTS